MVSPWALAEFRWAFPDAHRHILEGKAVHARNFDEKIDPLKIESAFYKSFRLEFKFSYAANKN